MIVSCSVTRLLIASVAVLLLLVFTVHQYTLTAIYRGVALPAGIHQLSDRIFVPNYNNQTGRELERVYYQYLEFEAIYCDHIVRVGRSGDGGWDLCDVEPYTPQADCLVYSFGINDDWSFDEAISTHYGCRVFSFDPSIGKTPKRNMAYDKIEFHPWGLADRNYTNERFWEMKTLSAIMNELGHTNVKERTLDYLKMDIEYSEWASMEAILTDNILPNVKQLGIEIHAFARRLEYRRFLDILGMIEALGFKRFSSHVNHDGFHRSPHSGLMMPCCHELVYINTHFYNG